MPTRTKTLIAALAAALLLPGTSAGGEAYDETDPYSRIGRGIGSDASRYDDRQDPQWREDKVAVPPPPGADAQLIEVALDELPKGFTAYIDFGTLSVNPVDRATRYWLVVRTPTSSNVSYEAINCATRELKVYAYADPRGSVRAVPNPTWKPIGFVRIKDYHWALADDYLCSTSSPREPRDVLSALKGHYSFSKPYSEYTENLRPER
jgi:hypothetical protein